MIDPNFRYIKFNNFPEEHIQRLRDIASENLEAGILGENATYIHDSKHRRFFIEDFSHVPFEINGVSFVINMFISKPNTGMWYTHVDANRDFALNIPLQVEQEKGYVLVYNSDDYTKLGKNVQQYDEITDEIKEILESLGRKVDVTDPVALENHMKAGKAMHWLGPTESDFEKVLLDKPMILNTSIPHSFVNHDDKFRVVASLQMPVGEDFNEAYDQSLKEFL